MREFTRAALAFAVILSAVFLLSGAFRLMANTASETTTTSIITTTLTPTQTTTQTTTAHPTTTTHTITTTSSTTTTTPTTTTTTPPQPKIKTITEITELDTIGVKGGTFHVKGEVTDSGGRRVHGITVLAYLMKNKGENVPQSGYGLTENGQFDITCDIPENTELGDYYVVAQSLGNDIYEGSWSDPKIRIVSETNILFSGPDRTMTNWEFTIAGRLIDKVAGTGLSSENVDVALGDLFHEALVTNEDGSFQTNLITLSSSDNYLISASFSGATFYLSSSAEHGVEVVQPFISPTTDENLVRGEAAQVSGEVPIENLTVQVFFDNGLAAEVKSGADGRFTGSFSVPSSRSLGDTTIAYAMPEILENVTQDVTICARTRIEARAFQESEPNCFSVTGRLLDDLGSPIPDAWLVLEYAENSIQGNTDNSGTASFEVEVPRGENKLEASLAFMGSEIYLPSENSISSAVVMPMSILGGILPFLILAAVAVAATTAALFKRSKKRGKKKPAEAPKKSALEKGLNLEISFPKIKNPFPDVWGEGEPLQISAGLTKRRKPVSGVTLKTEIDGVKETVHTSASGKCRIEYRLDKGTHRVVAEYAEGEDKLKAEREVRIVDYREEVVSIFNSVLSTLGEKGIDQEGNLTPREIQRETIAKIKRVDQEALDEPIKIFEVANYSMREIGRKEYERAYLSSRSVQSSAGGGR